MAKTTTSKNGKKAVSKNIKSEAKVEQKAVETKINAPDELAFDVKELPGGLKSTLEAIMITCSDPQDAISLAQTLAISPKEVEETLLELKNEYILDQRGFELKEYDGLWRFYSNPNFSEIVSKHIIGKSEQKLSIQALETLAIIAYKQPISRHAITQIRGVNVDGVVKTLTQRGLINEITDKKTGGFTYTTTALFLEKIGLKSLDELDPLTPYLPEDFEKIPEFEDPRKTVRNSSNNANELSNLDEDEKNV